MSYSGAVSATEVALTTASVAGVINSNQLLMAVLKSMRGKDEQQKSEQAS